MHSILLNSFLCSISYHRIGTEATVVFSVFFCFSLVFPFSFSEYDATFSAISLRISHMTTRLIDFTFISKSMSFEILFRSHRIMVFPCFFVVTFLDSEYMRTVIELLNRMKKQKYSIRSITCLILPCDVALVEEYCLLRYF